MISKLIVFIVLFIVGELIANLSIFRYLKRYFKFDEKPSILETKTSAKIFFLNLSVFKGMLERFVIYCCLVIDISQILIVFSALKIGTRLDKTKEITNDYFLVGNFISILLAIVYYYCFVKIVESYVLG